MREVLKVESLTKVFRSGRRYIFLPPKRKPLLALSNLSFSLYEGEILGILGANGAGKTTLIQLLLGALKPTSGQISYFGQPFWKNHSEVLQNLSFASAYHSLPGFLTVRENLEVIGRLYGMSKEHLEKRISSLLAQFGMEQFRNHPANALSAGQLARVLLAKAFLSEPKILLLDEPTASLDPKIAAETREFILKEQKERGLSILLTSHNMPEVALMCSRALVLEHGVVIQEGTPETLAKSVSLAEVKLKIPSTLEKAIAYLEEKNLHYKAEDHSLRISIDEMRVPEMLRDLTLANVIYTHIEIHKPTLEDYFLYLRTHE